MTWPPHRRSLGSYPWAFLLFVALIFFTWGEIFSLFPSTCTDVFGTKYATTNTALFYPAKGASALLVPFAHVIKSSTGSWWTVFVVAAVMNFIVVLLALFVLRPLRRSQERSYAASVIRQRSALQSRARRARPQ